MRLIFAALLFLPAATFAAPPATQPRDIDFTRSTVVTLHLNQATMKDACAALAGQAAIPTQIKPVTSVNARTFLPITIDVDKQPYLVALAKLCVAGKATINQFGHAYTFEISPLAAHHDRNHNDDPVDFETSWLASPMSVHGPMAVLARDIKSTQFRQLDAPAGQSSVSLTVSLKLLVEPQIRLTAISPFAEVTQAVDDAGQSLLPGYAWQLQWVEFPAGTYFEFPAVLQSKLPMAHKITTFAGALHARLVKRIETATLTGIDQGARSFEVADHDCKVTFSTQSPQDRRLSLTLMRGNHDPAEWATFQKAVAPGSRFHLLDAQGKPIDVWGRDSQQGENQFKMTLIHGARSPAQVIWEIPTASEDVAIPFEFRDLPLP